MSDNDEASKTEEPTAKKLSDAREKGQVAKTQELQNAFALLSGLLLILYISPILATGVRTELTIFIEKTHEIPTNREALGDFLVTILLNVGFYMLLPIGVFMFNGLLPGLVQVGLLFTTEPIKPSLNKLNPINGLKRMFSLKQIMEFLKSLVKLVVVGIIVGFLMMPVFKDIETFLWMELPTLLSEIQWRSAVMVAGAVGAVSVIAAFDYVYQKMEFMKQQRMTKQEVKDEFKNTEGDPMVKGRLRQLRQEKARRRMMGEVPGADVVVTNPSHFSVALKYDADTMHAPVVVAKGADLIAFKIREVARAHDVPVVANPPVARLLYASVELEEEVHPEHYQAVAGIISYVLEVRKRKGRRSRSSAQ